jgi:hypothetical protein
MRSGSARHISITILLVLFLTAVLPLISVSEGSQTRTRTQTGYISENDFNLQAEYNLDDLYVVVWIENRDTFYRQVPGRENFFNFREVANSFSFPVDGISHSSGEVKRTFVELFTATDCGYCPGAEGALDTLVEDRYPDEFTLIEWHSAINPGNDQYETPSSRSRFSKYNVTGRPTVIFDGMTAQIGGDQNPTNTQLPKDYGSKIDTANNEFPMVKFTGMADTGGNYLNYNISFEVINPMTKGDWVIRAMVVEDLKSDHMGARMRFVPRGTGESKVLTDLQTGFPDITIDEEATFDGLDKQSIRENLTVIWDADDPQDGEDVTVDILYRMSGEQWGVLEADLENTGSYKWNTAQPRVPDGTYDLRMIVRDTGDNQILTHEVLRFVIDNPDVPTGNFTFPTGFASMKGAQQVRWDSQDDEDEPLDMLARVSVSNDTGATWRIISYNIANGEDWIANLGSFDLNTLNYDDLPSYQLKVDLKDTDGMVTTLLSDIFEIYNNDAPRATLISPAAQDIVSSILDIGWMVTDQEDLPSGMTGNFSIRRSDQQSWKVLYHDVLDDGMLNKTFDTSILSGDGDYVLKFTVEDSRGKTHSVSREFTVYDPDQPQLSPITSPIKDLEDIRKDTITISWDGSDPDLGESLVYSVHISPDGIENWTLIHSDLSDTTAVIDLSGLQEGSYRIRLTASDDSPMQLTDTIFFGPFFYNAPDEPVINQFLTSVSLDNGLPDDVNSTIEEGEYFLEMTWSAEDDDDDNITYRIQYKRTGENEWTSIIEDFTGNSYSFNMTSLPTGEYRIRIVARDNSEKTLSSEMILGPFQWTNVILDTPADDTDDDDTVPVEDEDESDEPDWNLYIMIGVGSVVLIVIIVLAALFAASKLGGKDDSSQVIPEEKSMDYSQIPEFERSTPSGILDQAPVQQSQTIQTPQQIAPAEAPSGQVTQIEGQVKWEGTDQSGNVDSQNDQVNPGNTEETEMKELGAPPAPPV